MGAYHGDIEDFEDLGFDCAEEAVEEDGVEDCAEHLFRGVAVAVKHLSSVLSMSVERNLGEFGILTMSIVMMEVLSILLINMLWSMDHHVPTAPALKTCLI